MSLTRIPAPAGSHCTTRPGERGQVLILFTVILSVVFVAAAIAIDYGLWLSERRGVARASDLAALAAVQDLPADPGQFNFTSWADCDTVACDAAFEWAERNGYGEANGAVVEVQYYCANDIDFPPPGICFNENKDVAGFPLSQCPSNGSELGCDTVRVIVEKGATNLFSGFFGGFDIDIGPSAFAKVEFIVSPADMVMSIDASGSMQGNPITQARIAAKNFSTTILGDDPGISKSQVGYAPYRSCYALPPAGSCVPSIEISPNPSWPTNASCNNPGASWVLCLNQDVALLHEKIDDTQPSSNTNVCLGLYAAGQILKGPDSRDYTTDGEPVGKYIVLLTDGANVFNPHSSAPGDCWPTGVDDDAPPVPQRCGVGGGSTNEQLDVCTWELALALASDPDIVTPDSPLHIYVVGLNVNDGGPADDGETPADGICDDIGESDDDRRLLKCVATSTPDTNDHYFETDDANELGAIFQGIAYDIASRGLTSDSDE